MDLSEPTSSGSEDPTDFSKQRLHLERTLVSTLNSSDLNPDGTGLGLPFPKILCLAVLLYNFCHLRRYSIRGPVARLLQSRLIDALLQMQGASLLEQLPTNDAAALLWASVMSITHSSMNDLRVEAVANIVCELICNLRLRNLEEVETHLRSVVWTNDMWTDRLMEIAEETWREMYK